MTDQSAESDPHRIGPVARILSPMTRLRAVSGQLATRCDGALRGLLAASPTGLARPEERHRVSWQVLRNSPAEQRLAEARALVEELIEDGDWLSLADLAEEWDETRAHAGADHPLSFEALEAATRVLSCGTLAPSALLPVPVPRVPEDAVLALSALRERHPELPFLALLEANLHLMQAWEIRAAGGKSAAQRACLERSRWVVQPLLDDGHDSLLLARLRIGWLAFGCSSPAAFRRVFDACREADPDASYGDRWMGLYMLPRWHGIGDFEETLRAECQRLGARGPETYVHAHLAVKEMEPGLRDGIDGARFAAGLESLAARHAYDQHYLNRLLAQVTALLGAPAAPALSRAERQAREAMQGQIRNAAAAILRSHVTALHPGVFPDETPFLELMTLALPEAYARGDQFILDAMGLRSERLPQ